MLYTGVAFVAGKKLDIGTFVASKGVDGIAFRRALVLAPKKKDGSGYEDVSEVITWPAHSIPPKRVLEWEKRKAEREMRAAADAVKPTTEVTKTKKASNLIVCSVCQQKQRATEDKCFSCGASLVS